MFFEYRISPGRGQKPVASQGLDPYQYGSYPFSKGLRQDQLIQLAPGNTLSATFAAKLSKPLPKGVQVRALIHESLGERDGVMTWYDKESGWCTVARK